MTKLLINYFLLCALAVFLPIYGFGKMFLAGVDGYNHFYDYSAIYGLVVAIMLSGFSTLIILMKLWRNPIIRVLLTAVYLLLYYHVAVAIVWEFRMHFGTTWGYTEIFSTLINHKWYFYVFAFCGAFLYYLLTQYMYEKRLTARFIRPD